MNQREGTLIIVDIDKIHDELGKERTILALLAKIKYGEITIKKKAGKKRGRPKKVTVKRGRKPGPKKICSKRGCKKPVVAKGLCINHYQQMRLKKKKAGG